jgi:hypothetical protein
LRCEDRGIIVIAFTLSDRYATLTEGNRQMTYTRGAALALLVASASLVPLSEASAHRWRGGPFFLWPFAAAAAVVGTAAAVATAPFAAVAPRSYYAPPPGYYAPPPAYYPPPPGYYPPGYYYGR